VGGDGEVDEVCVVCESQNIWKRERERERERTLEAKTEAGGDSEIEECKRLCVTLFAL